jgi:hypothetical protein
VPSPFRSLISSRPFFPKELEALSAADAIGRLRSLGHPATLFGEGERDRLLRLHVVQRSINLSHQARIMMRALALALALVLFIRAKRARADARVCVCVCVCCVG